MPPDRDHSCIVSAGKFFSNSLIEIPHQRDLFQVGKALLHELAELLAEHRHCLSMAAQIGKRDPRDYATRAHRHVVNIASSVTWPRRHRMHPRV
jgi:hypothetical protein